MKSETEVGAIICLLDLVDLLKAEGEAKAGEHEGLLAYQALSRISSNAKAYGIALSDIGLEGYDIEAAMLNPKRHAA